LERERRALSLARERTETLITAKADRDRSLAGTQYAAFVVGSRSVIEVPGAFAFRGSLPGNDRKVAEP
jgi:hypothetical protein